MEPSIKMLSRGYCTVWSDHTDTNKTTFPPAEGFARWTPALALVLWNDHSVDLVSAARRVDKTMFSASARTHSNLIRSSTCRTMALKYVTSRDRSRDNWVDYRRIHERYTTSVRYQWHIYIYSLHGAYNELWMHLLCITARLNQRDVNLFIELI